MVGGRDLGRFTYTSSTSCTQPPSLCQPTNLLLHPPPSSLQVFPFLGSHKHRFQLLQHFIEAIRVAKGSARRQAVQVNIFTAFLCALKATAHVKGQLGKEKVVQVAGQLVMAALSNDDVILRCAAAEALGRMAQVAGAAFASNMVKHCVDTLQQERSVVGRTGYSLALGCIHRYVGGMGASKHLQATLGVVHALAQDRTDAVRTWALHALMLTVDSAGLDFQPYAKATLELACRVLHDDGSPAAHRCAGNVVNALITILGPELQARDLERETYHFILTDAETSPWPAVQLTSLHGMQQLILFAPTKVRVPDFMPVLKGHLTSPHLLLRHAATAILLQLAQRQPAEVHSAGDGVEKLLFRMLDGEDDPRLQSDVRECISTLIGALSAQAPSHWLVLCNQVGEGGC